MLRTGQRSKGMDKLVGPLAFSDKDPQGYLIDGFNEPWSIATHCNFEYLIGTLKALGFDKDIDLVVYKILDSGKNTGTLSEDCRKGAEK